MLKALFEPYTRGADNPVTSGPEFIRYMVNLYRGPKEERTYQSSQLNAIEQNAMTTGQIQGRCNQYVKECQEIYNRIRNLPKQLNPDTDEKTVTLVKENARKAAVLYNAYNSIIHMYFEVKLEQSMNYRIILKKFYQM